MTRNIGEQVGREDAQTMIAHMRIGRGLPAVATDTAWRTLAWPRRALWYSVPALAGALLAAGSAPASAQGVLPDPAANHVWADCQLSPDAVAEIQDSIINSSGGEDSPFGDVEVAFVVVYSLQENDGQALDEGESGFTGPILCAGNGFAVETTDELTAIPPDPEGEGDAVSVDILDLEEALVVRYAPNTLGFDEETEEEILVPGPPEKRICHTVDENNDCFTVFELFFDDLDG